MKIGDLVKFKNPNHPARFLYLKELGIVVGWVNNNPVVYFPSVTKAILKDVLEVIQ